MLTFTRNKSGTLYATFSDSNGPLDPTGTPQVTVYNAGVIKFGPVDLVKVSTGFWRYTFTVPNDWNIGDYAAVYTGTLAGIHFQNEENFSVIDDITTVYPTAALNYCTVADVMLYLAGVDTTLIASPTDKIASLIPIEERNIDNFCHQTFKKTSVTWNFSGAGTNKIIAPWRPIVTVTYMQLRVIPSISWYTFTNIKYINIHRDGLNVATLSADDTTADLYCDMSSGIFLIPPRVVYMDAMAIPFWNYTFLEVNKSYNVRCTLEYGWTNIPYELQHACAKKVAIQIMMLVGDKVSGGAGSMGVDGFNVNYGSLPFSGRIQKMEDEATAVLKRYRKLSI